MQCTRGLTITWYKNSLFTLLSCMSQQKCVIRTQGYTLNSLLHHQYYRNYKKCTDCQADIIKMLHGHFMHSDCKRITDVYVPT